MFEGVSEQLELLAEDAVETLEDKPAFPAKELLPAKVSGKKGAAVTRPRKNPEKKNRKGDTAPVADDAAPADADTAEDTVKYTKPQQRKLLLTVQTVIFRQIQRMDCRGRKIPARRKRLH